LSAVNALSRRISISSASDGQSNMEEERERESI